MGILDRQLITVPHLSGKIEKENSDMSAYDSGNHDQLTNSGDGKELN